MSEFVKIATNGQWTLNKSLHDEKGRCNNCGNKACDGADCKTDHAKVAVETNNEKNKGFKNQIKVSSNGQWNLKKSAEAIPSYQFKDVSRPVKTGSRLRRTLEMPKHSAKNHESDSHEYSVHQNGHQIGYASVNHDGTCGSNLDWDAHPHLESQLTAHHTSLKRPTNVTKN